MSPKVSSRSRKAWWVVWASLGVLLTLVPPAAADPVRLLVISNVDQALPEAYATFQATYGRDLLSLEVVNEDVAPERLRRADVVFAYMLRGIHEQRLGTAIAAARRRGARILVAPGSMGQTYWKLAVERSVNDPVVQYWSQGGLDNMVGFLAHAYVVGGGRVKIDVPQPVSRVERGIYHPRSATPFPSLEAYLRWYREQHIVPANAPLVGLAFFSTNWKFLDLAHIDAFVAGFERHGIGVVPAFDWPLGRMGDLFAVGGRSPLRTLFVLNQSMASRPEDPAILDALGVHTVNLLATRQSYQEWADDPRGLPIDRVRNMLDLPEYAGATEPTLFATLESVAGQEARVSRVVPERIDTLVRRTRRWMTLQDKANADKRVALIYYNHPPGRGSIGANYLAVIPSLRNILQRLQQEGYTTGAYLPDERRLTELLERSGRNIEQWAPGDLEDLVDAGGATLLPMALYKAWFAQLPARFRAATIARWGQPERSTLMTVTRGGERYFVIPGVRIGNLFLGPQPLRSTFDEYTSTAHDTVTPVPHQYVASYLWYREGFNADALVHVGRHGTLEWLPGKQTAQASWDTSEVLLGDLPNPYIYIVDGDGEAIQAKRRGAAVLVSHLTPMIVAGGALPDFATLDNALENLERTEGVSVDLATQYRETARNEIRRLKLDAQLRIPIETTPWDEVQERVHRFLHDTETNTLPLGLHTMGEAPPETNQREGLAAFMAYGFDESEAPLVKGDVTGWADAIHAGTEPTIRDGYPEPLRAKIARAIADGHAWIANVRESPSRELDALVTVLNGRHLSTASFGDPLRVPASLPTGRNEHASDTQLIPTKAAWAVGQKMAREFVSTYRKQHGGAYPEKVSQVLWSGETLRHQGALESMALSLLGVEPIWNARGVVDDLKLIPEAALGRPRVDVLFTISGIYRDSLPEKVLLLDKAVRLAASAGDNAISRHDREVAAALQKNGTAEALANQIARARVFGEKPGAYGVGVAQVVERSRDAKDSNAVGDIFMHNSNFVFSSETWGGTTGGALAAHLSGNQAVLFSRTSTLFGAADNDDVYQYFGGLGAATKQVNGGAAPDMFINNLRKDGASSMSSLQEWLASELNTRNWNEKWLKEMQRSGYGGAREMAKGLEYLYGFQATASEHMDGTFWQNSFDVLVNDRHHLGLQQFFDDVNPHAQQSILARLLEVDRQGSYRFSEADRATLVQKYVASVVRSGISCTANTCGNIEVNQYASEEAARIQGLGQEALRRFGQRLAHATGWTPQQFASAPAAVREGLRAGARPVPTTEPPPSAPAPPPDVTGFKLEERTLALPSPAPAPVSAWPLAAMATAIAVGILREMRRLGGGMQPPSSTA